MTCNVHRDGVSGEFDSHSRVKIINGFDETDTADLEQVVCIFSISGKTADDGENKS